MKNKYFFNIRLFEKFKNTFFHFTFLWNFIYPLNKNIRITKFDNIFKRIFYKIFWFWPRTFEASEWADDSIGGKRNPLHFVEVDERINLLIKKVQDFTPDLNVKILDLGCNVGRALNELHKLNYKNLYGVDISTMSNSIMKEKFPTLHNNVNFKRALFQEYLSNKESLFFDTLFTIGATIENVHPSYPLVQNMCRITKHTIILDIHDVHHSYPRLWEWEFNRNNFYLFELIRNNDKKNNYNTLYIFVRNK